MAFEQAVLDLPMTLTDTTGGPSANGAMPQFAPCFFDNANVDGVVNAGSARAGALVGINQSKGVDPVSGQANLTNVPTGQSIQCRVEGISRVLANGAFPAIGVPVAAQNSNGQVGPGAGPYTGGIVGYALEQAGIAGDVVACLLSPGLQPAFKQLGSVAAPLVANAVAGTQNAHAHGLGYIPHVVILVSAGATGTGVVYLSAASDSTNIYEKNTVASGTFIAYVA